MPGHTNCDLMPDLSKDTDSILLKGGLVVNHDTCSKADVLIEGGIIKDVGPDLIAPENARIIDVTDKFIIPGGVDLDCHLGEASIDDPLADTFETGSKFAVLGGTTTLVNTVNVPSTATLRDSFDHFVKCSTGRMFCDYAVCVRVPRFNEETGVDMEYLVKEKGVCLYSLVLGASGKVPDGEALNEEDFDRVLKQCRTLGALPVVPALTSPQLADDISTELIKECPNLGPELHQFSQPERAEADTIRKAALHAFESERVCPILISRIQSDLALRCFYEQRRYCRSLLFGQTTIAAIGAPLSAANNYSGDQPVVDLVTSKDWATAAGCVCDPPIRPDVNLSEKLIVHLNSSDALIVGSGHRAVSLEVKASFGLKRSSKIPKSIAALGCRLVALWDCAVENNGGIDQCSFVRAVSTDPARLANLYPQKGRIQPGSDADIVVWSKPDLADNGCWDKLMPAGVYNVFSGLSPRSRPEIVFLRGCIVVMNGKLVEDSAHGQFVAVKPFGQMAFSRVAAVDQSHHSQMEKIIREPYTGPVFGGTANGVREETREHHYFRKEYYDNMPKVGETVYPTSNGFLSNNLSFHSLSGTPTGTKANPHIGQNRTTAGRIFECILVQQLRSPL
ncbi:unnamed protein product [Echinostoma caproni]|uniref:dihydropyrimidinase n=1 Tax=Echinostoma caproni TaxID=27848 RepID=A0A183AJD8_9TREM|nr:unnamed protein product [Echinostoma caproni]